MPQDPKVNAEELAKLIVESVIEKLGASAHAGTLRGNQKCGKSFSECGVYGCKKKFQCEPSFRCTTAFDDSPD